MTNPWCCSQAEAHLVGGDRPTLRGSSVVLHYCPFCGRRLGASRDDRPLGTKLPTLVPRNQRICFDVDGVIADDDGQPSYPGRRPFPQALCAMGLLKQLGNTIIIHTARYMRRFCGDQQRAHAAGYWELVRWLDQHHVPYDEIYLGKPSADLYIDDRGKQLDGHDDLAWAQLVGEE